MFDDLIVMYSTISPEAAQERRASLEAHARQQGASVLNEIPTDAAQLATQAFILFQEWNEQYPCTLDNRTVQWEVARYTTIYAEEVYVKRRRRDLDALQFNTPFKLDERLIKQIGIDEAHEREQGLRAHAASAAQNPPNGRPGNAIRMAWQARTGYLEWGEAFDYQVTHEQELTELSIYTAAYAEALHALEVQAHIEDQLHYIVTLPTEGDRYLLMRRLAGQMWEMAQIVKKRRALVKDPERRSALHQAQVGCEQAALTIIHLISAPFNLADVLYETPTLTLHDLRKLQTVFETQPEERQHIWRMLGMLED